MLDYSLGDFQDDVFDSSQDSLCNRAIEVIKFVHGPGKSVRLQANHSKIYKGLRPSDTDDNEHEDENGGNVARTFASVVPIADSKRSKSE